MTRHYDDDPFAHIEEDGSVVLTEAERYRLALVRAAQRAYINNDPAPVLFWTGRIPKHSDAA